VLKTDDAQDVGAGSKPRRFTIGSIWSGAMINPQGTLPRRSANLSLDVFGAKGTPH